MREMTLYNNYKDIGRKNDFIDAYTYIGVYRAASVVRPEPCSRSSYYSREEMRARRCALAIFIPAGYLYISLTHLPLPCAVPPHRCTLVGRAA